MENEIRKPDVDLESNFSYNYDISWPFVLAEIHSVKAAIFGENDGANWHWIVELCDGRFGYVEGGCDYTGWDCQSGGSAKVFDSLKEATDQVPEKEDGYNRGNLREHIQKQLDGVESYGVIVILPTENE